MWTKCRRNLYKTHYMVSHNLYLMNKTHTHINMKYSWKFLQFIALLFIHKQNKPNKIMYMKKTSQIEKKRQSCLLCCDVCKLYFYNKCYLPSRWIQYLLKLRINIRHSINSYLQRSIQSKFYPRRNGNRKRRLIERYSKKKLSTEQCLESTNINERSKELLSKFLKFSAASRTTQVRIYLELTVYLLDKNWQQHQKHRFARVPIQSSFFAICSNFEHFFGAVAKPIE